MWVQVKITKLHHIKIFYNLPVCLYIWIYLNSVCTDFILLLYTKSQTPKEHEFLRKSKVVLKLDFAIKCPVNT